MLDVYRGTVLGSAEPDVPVGVMEMLFNLLAVTLPLPLHTWDPWEAFLGFAWPSILSPRHALPLLLTFGPTLHRCTDQLRVCSFWPPRRSSTSSRM